MSTPENNHGYDVPPQDRSRPEPPQSQAPSQQGPQAQAQPQPQPGAGSDQLTGPDEDPYATQTWQSATWDTTYQPVPPSLRRPPAPEAQPQPRPQPQPSPAWP
ncbi:hypothetical protein LG632_20645, partial [Streptomyces sp. SMC 277]|nr:hypothetical protein [Streptomyces antimicrobicus]